jgi:hypothetical protein
MRTLTLSIRSLAAFESSNRSRLCIRWSTSGAGAAADLVESVDVVGVLVPEAELEGGWEELLLVELEDSLSRRARAKISAVLTTRRSEEV